MFHKFSVHCEMIAKYILQNIKWGGGKVGKSAYEVGGNLPRMWEDSIAERIQGIISPS